MNVSPPPPPGCAGSTDGAARSVKDGARGGATMTTLRTEDIKGRPVVDSAGDELGHVEDVRFDPQALRITGFVVNVSKDAADRLSLRRGALSGARIEVGVERLRSIGDTVLLNLDQRAIAGLLFDRE